MWGKPDVNSLVNNIMRGLNSVQKDNKHLIEDLDELIKTFEELNTLIGYPGFAEQYRPGKDTQALPKVYDELTGCIEKLLVSVETYSLDNARLKGTLKNILTKQRNIRHEWVHEKSLTSDDVVHHVQTVGQALSSSLENFIGVLKAERTELKQHTS